MEIAVFGTIASILFAYLAYHKGVKTDSTKTGMKDGELKTDIEYIKRRTDEVLIERRDTNKTISSISERLVRVEEMSKSAHKRIDEIEVNCKEFRRER